ncbi:MAG: HEPN domain protein [Candidatus Magnetoglobus multicellularis str. Araruama]|uniref:HEPN domain protein n=1 Tax=Candidatus Magnetoglobus multicellularis str. Araruama TaxID=890399 RepID=A0A1V1NVM4_9BACT|nr:MAG: HEPN domain protein [Candidatus Magnetoglobus multicellularis str. Araruama]
MQDYSIFLKKGHESLFVAQHAYDKECYNSCINRAYYSMFQVTIALLIKSGNGPKSKKIGHDWVQSEFSRLFIIRSKKFTHFKGLLNQTQELRNTADYSSIEINKKKAKRVLEKTEIFVEQISKEINHES